MPKVTFIIEGAARTVEFEEGRLAYKHHGLPGSILDVALNFDVPLDHACGGFSACTTCHVIIREGMGHLSEMQDDEADRLDTAWNLTPQSRLGCQAIVRGDVVCELPRYTRNYVSEGGALELGKPAGRSESQPE
jgi:ferredoxin, 2Fe-2S